MTQKKDDVIFPTQEDEDKFVKHLEQIKREDEANSLENEATFPTQEEQEAYFDRLEEINEGESRRRDAEVSAGEADVDRWRFNRDFFGEDYAAAEELAWDLRYGDW